MQMESLPFSNYNMEDGKPIFTTASDTQPASTESFTLNGGTLASSQESGFSPMAAPFQTRMGNELLTLMSQNEPRQADTAPSATDIDDVLMNLRLNGSDLLFDETEQSGAHNYFMGGSRADNIASPPSNMWAEGSTNSGARNGEMIDTFDFLIKSISSANNYVSMLTREQLYVLRSIRPSLLYEFLQEVAKVRSDKRMRRALPNECAVKEPRCCGRKVQTHVNECAFCKNNGENEECYSSHALKDWRGRVLCPVLRAFRCPRCGATGDRAHTIKYCPENVDGGLERSGSLSSRRRMTSAPLLPPRGSPSPAAPSPASPLPHSSLWSNFGIN